MRLALVLLSACSSLGPAPAPTDEVLLGEGRAVRGTIVKQTAEALFVDVGPTIVSLPRGSVVSIRRDVAAADGPASGVAPGAAPARGERRSELSVRENVARVEGGVVLVRTPAGQGSGFVIDAHGHVITNAHVVEGERNVTVTLFRRLAGGLEKTVVEDVRILALNPYWDLALLELPSAALEDVELVPIPIAPPGEVRTGETIFVIGNPLGLERSVSEGIVSTTARQQEGMLYLQTTAAINPGNSGGPVFNLRGEMVGVATSGYIYLQGLNFAIPAATVEAFLEHRDAFAYSKENPNAGFRYLPPPRKGGG